MWTRCWRLENR